MKKADRGGVFHELGLSGVLTLPVSYHSNVKFLESPCKLIYSFILAADEII